MAVQNYHTETMLAAKLTTPTTSIQLSQEGGMLLVPAAGAVIVCSRRFWEIKNTAKAGDDSDSTQRLFVRRGAVTKDGIVMPTAAALATADNGATQALKAYEHEILPGEALALRPSEIGADDAPYFSLIPESGVLKVRLSGARGSIG